MTERTKKILIAALFVVVVAGVAYLLYSVFFKPTAPPAVQPGAAPTYNLLPTAGKAIPQAAVTPTAPGALAPGAAIPSAVPGPVAAPSRTQVVSSQPANAISLSPTGELRTYNPTDGKFYKIADDGTVTPLSNNVFYSVQKVDWGHSTDKAILTYPDGSKTLYDFTKDKQVTLPSHWEQFDFAPQDDRIVAKSMGNNESNRFLITANPDGTNARAIEDMGDNADYVRVGWSPNNQVVAFSMTGEPMGMDRQQVLLVGQNHENFKGLVVEGRGFEPSWSPSGNNLLYSVYSSNDGFRPRLWVSGASGDNVNANRRDIGLMTWADKCVWQNETAVVCAVPTSLEEGSALQRDIAVNVPDNLYKINLQTGTTLNLGAPDGNPTVEQPTLSKDGKTLYYSDRQTGKLMKFAL